VHEYTTDGGCDSTKNARKNIYFFTIYRWAGGLDFIGFSCIHGSQVARCLETIEISGKIEGGIEEFYLPKPGTSISGQ
jgi:hypothetical protein